MDLFANRVHEAHFVNGIVRLEFCVAPRNESGEFSGDAPVKPEDIHFTVNLPLTGFTRSLGIVRKFAQELQEKGIMRKPENQPGAQDVRAQSRAKQTSLVDITSEDEGSSGQGGQPLV
jgi:hypothetical protein